MHALIQHTCTCFATDNGVSPCGVFDNRGPKGNKLSEIHMLHCTEMFSRDVGPTSAMLEQVHSIGSSSFAAKPKPRYAPEGLSDLVTTKSAPTLTKMGVH